MSIFEPCHNYKKVSGHQKDLVSLENAQINIETVWEQVLKLPKNFWLTKMSIKQPLVHGLCQIASKILKELEFHHNYM